jgi:hypothetical protein
MGTNAVSVICPFDIVQDGGRGNPLPAVFACPISAAGRVKYGRTGFHPRMMDIETIDKMDIET